MRLPFGRIASILLACLLLGCASTRQLNTVTQVSTIDAILAGAYEGKMATAEMATHGDFGIGTFDSLDGEMIHLNGITYQVKADGKVYLPMGGTTPFAAVVNFVPDTSLPIESRLKFAAFKKAVDGLVPDQNLFQAVKVTGTFSYMKTRSVPKQKRPYPPLVEVTRNQPVFELRKVKGTIVGFRCPPFVKGINVPSYHLHFLADDLSSGGHILDFTVDDGMIEVDTCNKFTLILPTDSAELKKLDLGKDRTKELHEAEQDKVDH